MERYYQSKNAEKFYKLPYPDGLLLTLEVALPVNEDQRAGLEYALAQFNTREREIINFRFAEHMTYKSIADKYGVSPQYIRQLAQRGLRKLKRKDLSCYYLDGYNATIKRLE